MEVKMTKNQNCRDLKHISNYLSSVEDFRMEKKCLHILSDILFIGLLTFLSSGEDYEDMVLFGKRRLKAAYDIKYLEKLIS